CAVTGLDYVPQLLDKARVRTAAEGLSIEYVEGDAEGLPFPDAPFDAVISVVGVMFAPDQVKAAAELTRVCRPGGTIALASWAPDGFVGEVFALLERQLPSPTTRPPHCSLREMFPPLDRPLPSPNGLRSPLDWGDAGRLRDLLPKAPLTAT